MGNHNTHRGTLPLRTPEVGTGTVHRHRLYKAIDRSPCHTVWLEAPSGAGKTELVAGYLACRGIPSWWYRMVPGNHHPDNLLQTVKHGFNGSLAPPPAPPRANRDGTVNLTDAKHFFYRLLTHVATPFALVIDDCHEGEEPMGALLAQVVDTVPDGIHLFLLGRAAPPGLFPTPDGTTPLRLDGHRLRITPAEARAMAKGAGRDDLSQQEIELFLRRSGGLAGTLSRLLDDTPDNTRTFPPKPWRVAIHSLGAFSITTERGPLPTPPKSQKRPLEILKLLVTAGPSGMAESRIIDTVWPDADGDAGIRTLATTLHRLRAIIGCDGCVERLHGTLRINPEQVWVDAWAFARRLPENRDTPLGPDTVRKALALYRGRFLSADSDPVWTLMERDRLHGLFVQHLTRLGRHYETVGMWSEAEALYRQGLAVDPLSEPFYQGVMRACTGQGRRAEAVTAYARCRDILHRELGVSPGPETERELTRIGQHRPHPGAAVNDV